MIPKQRAIYWTFHARGKMRQYKLSAQRVLRVLHFPKRIEEGIAPKTMAAMQPSQILHSETSEGKPTEKWTQELWVMVQDAGRKRKIISAWRYPGMSKGRTGIPMSVFRDEYKEYLSAAAKEMEQKDAARPKIDIGLKWRGDLSPQKKRPVQKRMWPKRPFRRSAPQTAIQVE
ncbi:MAG: hypothetical protein RL681_316 [Candidatus Parcubacteria bacterium]|jgi:hypothetical protein